MGRSTSYEVTTISPSLRLSAKVISLSGLLSGARRRSARGAGPAGAPSASRSGIDLAFVPMLVGFAVDEPPHVEMGGRVGLPRIARVRPRADGGYADDVISLRRHGDDLGAPILRIGWNRTTGAASAEGL